MMATNGIIHEILELISLERAVKSMPETATYEDGLIAAERIILSRCKNLDEAFEVK